MSGELARVEARIETVHKLSEVIAAMRGIAASRSHEAHEHLDAIRAYAGTIRDAIGHALALMPAAGAIGPTASTDHNEVLLVICAEQGFAGTYTADVLQAAADCVARSGNSPEVLLVGDRGLHAADEHHLRVSWSTPMIAHSAQAASLASRITDVIYQRIGAGQISGVKVIHATPGGISGHKIFEKQVVPLDLSRITSPTGQTPPRITLPPEQLLASLIEEYLYAELNEAVMLAFAAENEARMRAMIAAHENITQTQGDLAGLSRRLRQDDITNEITELATSSLLG